MNKYFITLHVYFSHTFLFLLPTWFQSWRCNTSSLQRRQLIRQWDLASQVELVVKKPPANVGDARHVGLITGLGRFPWNIKWQPNSVFLPQNVHGQKSLKSYSLWDHKKSDKTEQTLTMLLKAQSGWLQWGNECLPCVPDWNGINILCNLLILPSAVFS